MIILNFMTAVYWGQLSKCQILEESVLQYSCSQKTAYGAVSAFAVLLFLSQIVFGSAIIHWKGELVNESGSDDDTYSGSNDQTYHEVSFTNYFPTSTQSADL